MAYLCNGEVQFRVQVSDMKKWNKVLGMLRMYNLHTYIYIGTIVKGHICFRF